MSIKMHTAVENNKDPSKIKWVKCPTCRTKTSFNTENPIVDINLCKALSAWRHASPAPAAVARNTRNENITDLSHDNDSLSRQTVTDVVRKSQRIRRAPVSRDIATDATRNATIHRDKRSNSANERNSGVKRRTTHNISTIGGNAILESPRVDNEFTKIVGKAQNLFCIRQFKEDSKTDADPLGRNPSEWALRKGYILSSDRALYAAGFPENPLEYLRETDLEDIKNTCRNVPRLFPSVENLARYCSRYKIFAEMEEGDMVVMNVPGRPKEGEAYFGVVTSNSLKTMSPGECEEEGFPAMHLLGGGYNFNGLMLREVKWLRKGLVRKLPGQKTGRNGANTVPWINESVTIWLSKSTDSHSGLEIMKRPSFIENTSSV
jgi:hypothetical protein